MTKQGYWPQLKHTKDKTLKKIVEDGKEVLRRVRAESAEPGSAVNAGRP